MRSHRPKAEKDLRRGGITAGCLDKAAAGVGGVVVQTTKGDGDRIDGGNSGGNGRRPDRNGNDMQSAASVVADGFLVQ